ncbi:MAG: GNAT family N-acetyltransferase, partial [Candidatus Lokiarchaeota archaeon]|nr:GNAT family N-acetyltransferase [Candidatus Lokiarchaeota archaeon]
TTISKPGSLPAAPAAPKAWASLRPACPGDAAAIQHIYHEVYQGTYTYKEYTDQHYLAKDMTSGHANWYVIQDAEQHDEIAGCVSATVDVDHWRAYSRGMMMRPAWQGKGGASKLFGEAFQDLLRCFKGNIRFLWSETRADSPKPQAVCEAIGLQPLGILPGKDVFFGRRETPVLMAIYSSSAWKSREARIALVPELVPVYEAIRAMHRPMRKDEVTVAAGVAIGKSRCQPAVDVAPFAKQFGYTTCIFTCEKTGESLSINVNAQCMNAEGMELHCAKASTARALLAFALGYLRGKGVRYVEGYCPASKPALQEAFLSAGYRPFGYVPAWNKDARTGLHVDHVVFGWSAGKVDDGLTRFTEKSSALRAALGL